MTGHYGCHNEPREEMLLVRDGYTPEAEGASMVVHRRIRDVLSRACQFDQRATDPRCVGCAK